MVSTRISFAILAAYVATIAVAKPYAPELYARSGLVEKREVAASRPYAPEIIARQIVDEDADIVIKRTVEDSSFDALGFLGMREASEEELHARGQVADSLIEKRGSCTSDTECEGDHYCSSKKNFCYRKISNGKHCTRDYVCKTNFCNPAYDKCQAKKHIGSRCRGDSNQCASGYCSVITDRCRQRAEPGGKCQADAGCKPNASCVNGTCRLPSENPSPSGSASNKRMLTHL